jgi:hypothetical protein
VTAKVLEEALAVHALERCPALAHRVEQARRGLVVRLAARDHRPLRGRQRRAERRQVEAPVVELLDDVLDREAAQHAGEGGGPGGVDQSRIAHGADAAADALPPIVARTGVDAGNVVAGCTRG